MEVPAREPEEDPTHYSGERSEEGSATADDPEDPSPEGEELFIALIYPVGTDSSLVLDTIKDALIDVNYQSDPPLHLIDELTGTPYGQAKLQQVREDPDKRREYEGAPAYFRQYMELMDLGNAFRQDIDPGVMGWFAASQILKRRLAAGGPPVDNLDSAEAFRRVTNQRHAYLIRSLKVPDEIDRLRNIYGDALTVVAIHSDEETRRRNLTWKIQQSAKKGGPIEDYRPYADRLIARDYREGREDWGQHVSDAFTLADVYVDATNPQRLEESIRRFIEILFRHRFRTPTKDEYAMFHAYGAALRSADLSRQVGASIVDDDGEIIALGTNEVPKAGGGSYWPDDSRDDGRDFVSRRDVSTEMKRSALEQLLEELNEEGLLRQEVTAEDVWGPLQGTDFMNVGEFGRATHAEMGAIVHAARRGRSIQGAALYTTTFPCHVCARHIVQAGIARVIYNEPYPKSLAAYLHMDSIVIGGPGAPYRVLFRPFVGVSPTLYAALFRVPRGKRKTEEGQIAVWPRRTARPSRFADPNSYIPKEVDALHQLAQTLDDKEVAGDANDQPGA